MTAPVSERRVALGSLSGFLAYGFGSGLAPWAPGTFGTLALSLIHISEPTRL